MDPLYVATPSLLAHFGITPAAVDPAADVLSARKDLGGLKLFTPEFRAGPTPQPGPGAAPQTPKVSDVTPQIQAFRQLPLYTSAPGTLLTTGAMQRLGLDAVPAAWWIQASGPLTSQQIQTARATAASIGLYLETTTKQASLAPLRNWSTAVGILLALGVLGMTVGLIRSETAGDLRVLAADRRQQHHQADDHRRHQRRPRPPRRPPGDCRGLRRPAGLVSQRPEPARPGSGRQPGHDPGRPAGASPRPADGSSRAANHEASPASPLNSDAGAPSPTRPGRQESDLEARYTR